MAWTCRHQIRVHSEGAGHDRASNQPASSSAPSTSPRPPFPNRSGGPHCGQGGGLDLRYRLYIWRSCGRRSCSRGSRRCCWRDSRDQSGAREVGQHLGRRNPPHLRSLRARAVRDAGARRGPSPRHALTWVGVAGFEPAASSSRSKQLALLTSPLWASDLPRQSVGISWHTPVFPAVVTHLVTRADVSDLAIW